MSKQATEFQRKEMSRMYRGKQIFKPLNTGWIDERVACVREWVANLFFYRKGDTTIMIDAGYNYDRLAEKMSWLRIRPQEIDSILVTHQDTDHVGAVEADSPGLFKNATLYVGEIENRYLTGEARRRVIYHLYRLPQVTINNKKALLHDGQTLEIGGVRIECFLVPGHTWGHMVYLIDDKYLFTGDTLWFGADGGYSFISALAEDNVWRCVRLTRWRISCARGGSGRSSSPATPAGRTISSSPSPIRISSVRPSESACPIPARPMTRTTNRTTRRSGRSPAS